MSVDEFVGEIAKFQEKVNEMMRETIRGNVSQINKLLMIEHSLNLHLKEFENRFGKKKLQKQRKYLEKLYDFSQRKEASKEELEEIKNNR